MRLLQLRLLQIVGLLLQRLNGHSGRLGMSAALGDELIRETLDTHIFAGDEQGSYMGDA